MPLPSQTSFESTKLPPGLSLEGLGKTRTSFKSPDGPMVDPVAGGRFLCLDDPEAVNGFRMRLNPAAARKFDGLRAISARSGVPTLAADGARLICRSVTMPRGARLSFAWHFMVWGDMPWNDFAAFEAVPDTPSDYGVGRYVLCDLAELAVSGRRSSDWRIATWTLAEAFQGTLVWTVANGQEVTDPAITVCADEAFANPPALLLDDIRVRT